MLLVDTLNYLMPIKAIRENHVGFIDAIPQRGISKARYLFIAEHAAKNGDIDTAAVNLRRGRARRKDQRRVMVEAYTNAESLFTQSGKVLYRQGDKRVSSAIALAADAQIKLKRAANPGPIARKLDEIL